MQVLHRCDGLGFAFLSWKRHQLCNSSFLDSVHFVICYIRCPEPGVHEWGHVQEFLCYRVIVFIVEVVEYVALDFFLWAWSHPPLAAEGCCLTGGVSVWDRRHSCRPHQIRHQWIPSVSFIHWLQHVNALTGGHQVPAFLFCSQDLCYGLVLSNTRSTISCLEPNLVRDSWWGYERVDRAQPVPLPYLFFSSNWRKRHLQPSCKPRWHGQSVDLSYQQERIREETKKEHFRMAPFNH